MKKLPSMVDMSLDEKEREEIMSPSPPRYPYGLSICLCQDELDKLNVDAEEVSVGDMIHLLCMAKVTSVSLGDNEISGPHKRIELQITHIAADGDDEENQETNKGRTSKLYL